MIKTYSAGIVTAYGAAKRAGYTGTYEDFCRQQAGYAENATAVEQAKTDAINAKNDAVTAKNTAVSAKDDAVSAKNDAVSAKNTATTKAQEASQSATSAGQSATSAGQSATSAEASARASAQSADDAEQSAQSVSGSLAQIQTNKEDIDTLKADLGDLSQRIYYEVLVPISRQSISTTAGTLLDRTNTQFSVSIPSGTTYKISFNGTGLINKYALYYNTTRIATNRVPNTVYEYTASEDITSFYIYVGASDVIGTGELSVVIDGPTIQNDDSIEKNIQDLQAFEAWTENILVKKEFSAPARQLYASDVFVNKTYTSTANGSLLTGDSYATWYCAYKIPCKPAHNYRTTIQTQVCFYDSSGTFISAYVPTIDGSNCTGVKVEMDFETPNGCEYFSINTYSENEIVFDMEYEEYGNGKSVYPLIEKTVVCFGDSITGNYYFGDNYPYQIEEKTGAKVYNVGFGGCRMELSNDVNLNYINPFSMVSLADAIVSDASTKWDTQDANVSSFAANRIVRLRLDILKSIDFSNVDIVTIAYGTNGLENPIDDSEDVLNTHTFAGATRYAVKTLLTEYPHLRIVLLTPVYKWYNETSDDGDTHEVNGHTLLQRVTKLLEVGNEVKLPTIDLYHTLGINKYNYTGYFGDDNESADGTHINSFGREQMGLRIGGELNRLF